MLLDLAEPLLPERRGLDEIETAVLAAAEVWNAARPGVPALERDEALREAEELLEGMLGGARLAGKEVRRMYRVVRTRYDRVDRRILEVRVADRGEGTAHVQVLSTIAADDGDPLADPRLAAVAGCIATVAGGHPAATDIARRQALQALDLFLQLEPERFDAGEPELWAGASLHAALRNLPEPRLTIDELTARLGVKRWRLGRASRELRRVVDWDLVFRASGHPFGRLVESVGHQAEALGIDEPGERPPALAAATTGAHLQPASTFHFERFVEDHGIDPEAADRLWRGFLRGLRDLAGTPGHGTAAALRRAGPRRHEPMEINAGTLGLCMAPGLRDLGLSEPARRAASRYLLGLLDQEDTAAPLDLRSPRAGMLLPVLMLAREGVLAGTDLRVVIGFVCRDREAVEGLTVDEVVELARLAAGDDAEGADGSGDDTEGADGSRDDPGPVATLTRLLEQVARGRDPRTSRAAIECLAFEEALPVTTRGAALTRLVPTPGEGEPDRPARLVPEAARAAAAAAWARLQRRPARAALELLERAEAAAEPALFAAAAQVLHEHGADLEPESLRPALRRGTGANRAAIRKRYYRAALRHLGEEGREWALADRAAGVRAWAESLADGGGTGEGTGGVTQDPERARGAEEHAAAQAGRGRRGMSQVDLFAD